MKNIVVPTDFSENARNALQYAIQLANRFEGTIHLIHCFDAKSQTGSYTSIRHFMADEAKRALATVLQSVKDDLHIGTELEAHAIEGATIPSICEYANNIKVDLVVMGTQGASGFKEFFLGTVTAGLIQKSKIPVLAIPQGFTYRRLNRIAFAIDQQVVCTSLIVQPLCQIAHAFQSLIQLVQVKPKTEQVLLDTGLSIYLKDLKHQLYSIDHNDINEGLNYFVYEQQADMLCMIHRRRSFLDSISQTSRTRKEVFNSPVPLLVLMDID